MDFSVLKPYLLVMKGLHPLIQLGYTRKINLFAVAEDLNLYVDIMSKILNSVKINKNIIKKLVELDFSVWLVKILNITFCNSYEITEKIVKLIEEKKCKLCEFDPTGLQKIESKLQVIFYHLCE